MTATISRSVLVTIPELCTGCRICEIRCAFRHYGQYNPSRARIRVTRDDEMGADTPGACRQCGKCPVIEVCPNLAIFRDQKTGAVVILEEKCKDAELCVEACPFHTVFIDPTTKLALNCDLCGGDPECAKYCPTKAVQYVPVEKAGKLSKPIPAWAPTER